LNNCTKDNHVKKDNKDIKKNISRKEVKAVWIPYMDFSKILTGRSISEFQDNIRQRFEKAASFGINTVFVHIRSFGDALYNSSIFPASSLITGTEGDKPPFDPLEIMIEEAHALNLHIEGWLNPFRIRNHLNKAKLAPSNPAISLLVNGSNAVISFNGGLYYNPASDYARHLVIETIKELIDGYNLDGIHFDDYFYATQEISFDSIDYTSYKAQGGGLSLYKWRRENVNILVRNVYSTIKSKNPALRFGISPKADMECNLNEEFIDVPHLLSCEGYLDYICPQAYFGFKDRHLGFKSIVSMYNEMITLDSIDLYIGLGAYKIGHVETHAGPEGIYEWVENRNMLADMVDYARTLSRYAGFSLYNFSAAFEPEDNLIEHTREEMMALKALL
jgi:uncharacterized lipoprotein YddW (UPF0748 family)